MSKMSLCFVAEGSRMVLRPCTERRHPVRPLANTPTVKLRIVKQYPHDPTAFTQGLALTPNGKTYYESTGLYGRSTVREVDLLTGRVLRSRPLPTNHFGEGITLLPSGGLVQLTWREQVAHVYGTNFTTGSVAQFTWPREGWGITYTANKLIISDGSSTLYFVQAIAPYKTQSMLIVRERVNGQLRPVVRLNELEMVGGDLYANIWQERRIAVIDITTGIVKRWLDLSLLPVNSNPDAVLNGIAYHPASNRLFVTGKLWSWMYEVEVPV